MNRRCGFTLIEVVVALLVLGIMLGFLVPQYFTETHRMHGKEAEQVMFTAHAGYVRRVADGESVAVSQISGCWSRLGMSDPNTMPARKFTYSWIPGQPTVRATYNTDTTKRLSMNLQTGALDKSSWY